MSSEVPSETDSRFAYLMQPIRDIAKNWNVDIATHLEDYLEELENIKISFDGGSTTMNFVEAALLIQGSTCVYSKKVEYLYNLAYQVLDLVNNNKKFQKQAGSVDDKGNDNDVDFRENKEEFLCLDDIREHKYVCMKEENIPPIYFHQTPLILTKFDENLENDSPLLSKDGEILGNMNDFRLNSCKLHHSGALLMNLQQASLLYNHSEPQLNIHDSTNENKLEKNADSIAENADSVAENFHPAPDELMNISVEPPDPICDDSHSVHNNAAAVATAIINKPVKNFWEPLDPHKSFRKGLVPFKKGRTTKFPPSLQCEQTKKRKRPTNSKESQTIIEFMSKAFSQKTKTNTTSWVCLFETLFLLEHQRRKKIISQLKAKLVGRGRYAEAASVHELVNNFNTRENAAEDDFDDDPIGDNVSDAPSFHSNDNDSRIPPIISEDSLVLGSYEELLYRHVDNFMVNAQQYTEMNDLTKKVIEWEQKILPKLKKEEEHRVFDIHLYGSEVIAKTNIDEETPFRNIVKDMPGHEACRYFLATLQLANNGNIEISCSGEDLLGRVDSMNVKLLNSTRHHEELQEYRAPSLNN